MIHFDNLTIRFFTLCLLTITKLQYSIVHTLVVYTVSLPIEIIFNYSSVVNISPRMLIIFWNFFPSGMPY